MKRLFSLILSLSVMLSMATICFSPVSFAVGGELMVIPDGAMSIFRGLAYVGLDGATAGTVSALSLASKLGSSSINFSVEGNTFSPETNFSYSPNKGTYYQYDGSGATYNYQYNSNDYRSYQVFNTSNKYIYNPVTNTYNTYNNYYYNSDYDIFYFEGDTYNTYFTTNVTYVSYYISDNITNNTYYYQIYYQLPDGRNSWDLKAEDVWGTYFIYDLVNYDTVVEDDGITLGLYHFDSNLTNYAAMKDEVSFFNNITSSFVDGFFLNALKNDSTSYRHIDIEYTEGQPLTVEYRVKYSNFPSSYTGSVSAQYNTRSGSTSGGQSFTETATWGIPSTYYLFGNHSQKYQVGSWYSIAIVYDGGALEDSSFTVFVNGTKTSSCTYKQAQLIENTAQFYLSNPSHTPQHSGSVNGVTYTFSSLYSTSQYPLSFYSWQRGDMYIDELRISKGALYSDDYTPRSQPFDSNLVTVLPSAGYKGLVAVKSDVPVGKIRVGGVRPTYPANGDVYVYLSGSVVADIQQFQVDGWYSVEGAIHDGSTWVSLLGYNMEQYCLESPDGGSSDPDPTPTPPPDTGGDTGGSGGGLFGNLFSGLLETLSGAIMALLSLFASIFSFVSALVAYVVASLSFLPPAITTIFTVAVPIILLLILIKFIRG